MDRIWWLFSKNCLSPLVWSRLVKDILSIRADNKPKPWNLKIKFEANTSTRIFQFFSIKEKRRLSLFIKLTHSHFSLNDLLLYPSCDAFALKNQAVFLTAKLWQKKFIEHDFNEKGRQKTRKLRAQVDRNNLLIEKCRNSEDPYSIFVSYLVQNGKLYSLF